MTPPGQGGIAITPSPAGRLRAIDPGNGVLSQYSHDRAGRLTRIEHSAGGGAVARVVYDLDSHGNRIAETVTQGAVTRSLGYGFDAADRLVRITAPDGETTWTLDGAGNRQTETLSVSGTPVGVRTYSHDARNQLTDIQDTAGPLQSFSYDGAGRQLSKTVGAQTWQHTWSAQDRLLSLTLGQGPPSVRYDYDADGQRIAREVDGQRQQYVWDGLALQAQTNALGNVLASYTQAGRHTLSARHGSTTSHYHLDALGTPLALTAPDGTVQVRYQTDAWGNEQSASASHPNPIGFTGYLKDPATDELYAQARQYSPATGSFTSRDELRGDPMVPMSLHRYLYAHGNPTVYVDLDGRAAVLSDIAEFLEQRRVDASNAAVALGEGELSQRGTLIAGVTTRTGTVFAGLGAGLIGAAEYAVKLANFGVNLIGERTGIISERSTAELHHSFEELESFAAGAANLGREAWRDPAGVTRRGVDAVATFGHRVFIDGDPTAQAQFGAGIGESITGWGIARFGGRASREGLKATDVAIRRSGQLVNDTVDALLANLANRIGDNQPRFAVEGGGRGTSLTSQDLERIFDRTRAGMGDTPAALRLIGEGEVDGVRLNSAGRPIGEAPNTQFLSYAEARQRAASPPRGNAATIEARHEDLLQFQRIQSTRAVVQKMNERRTWIGRVEKLFEILDEVLKDGVN